MVPLSKSGVRKHRGFESRPLRHRDRRDRRRPPAERSPSGLGRRTGNAVWGNPSRVQIPPSPPLPSRPCAPLHLGQMAALSCIRPDAAPAPARYKPRHLGAVSGEADGPPGDVPAFRPSTEWVSGSARSGVAPRPAGGPEISWLESGHLPLAARSAAAPPNATAPGARRRASAAGSGRPGCYASRAVLGGELAVPCTCNPLQQG